MLKATLERLMADYPLPWQANAIGTVLDANDKEIIQVYEREDDDDSFDYALNELIAMAVNKYFGVKQKTNVKQKANVKQKD